MHVLLTEAEVNYGRLRELKDVNGQFPAEYGSIQSPLRCRAQPSVI
jgi:NAD/NADP transhydrogenase beta subunit